MADIDHGRRRSLATTYPSPLYTWAPAPTDNTPAPHSHHGTPAHEFSGFDFGTSVRSSPIEAPHDSGHGRPVLQPLVTSSPVYPQYPSMLNSYPVPVFNGPIPHPRAQPIYHQPVQPIQSMPMPMGPLQTPVSASSSKPLTNPRKTLSDADRRRMCEYAENNPQAKQMEIGNIFGVERSTVSKVLRQREKFLQQEEGSRSPHKRTKGSRLPDIEKTLSNWAKNQEKKGVALTDDILRERIQAFSATTSPELQQTMNASWLEKFKLKYNLMGARSRKSSLAPDDTDLSSEHMSRQASSSWSPLAPPQGAPPRESILGSADRRGSHAESEESLAGNSPDEFMGFPGNTTPFTPHLLKTSDDTDEAVDPISRLSPAPLSPPLASHYFTPDSGTESSPFIPQPPLTARLIPQMSTSGNPHRPRSQTFPVAFDPYMATTAEDFTPHYISASVLDSPMEEPNDPLLSISSTLNGDKAGERTDSFDASAFGSSRTVSLSDTMGPPPLPSHVYATATTADSGNSTHGVATLPVRLAETMVNSTDEARNALELVMGFFAKQNENPLSPHETATLAKLVNKLKLQSNEGS